MAAVQRGRELEAKTLTYEVGVGVDSPSGHLSRAPQRRGERELNYSVKLRLRVKGLKMCLVQHSQNITYPDPV